MIDVKIRFLLRKNALSVAIILGRQNLVENFIKVAIIALSAISNCQRRVALIFRFTTQNALQVQKRGDVADVSLIVIFQANGLLDAAGIRVISQRNFTKNVTIAKSA